MNKPMATITRNIISIFEFLENNSNGSINVYIKKASDLKFNF